MLECANASSRVSCGGRFGSNCTAFRCRCEAREKQLTCDSHQSTHWPARTPVPQRNKNSHKYASTRARYNLASSTCCSAQTRAKASGDDPRRSTGGASRSTTQKGAGRSVSQEGASRSATQPGFVANHLPPDPFLRQIFYQGLLKLNPYF